MKINKEYLLKKLNVRMVKEIDKNQKESKVKMQ